MDTEYLGPISTTLWPDEKGIFSKFVIREVCKLPYENLKFSRQAIPKIPSFLCYIYTVATAYRVCFNLDNSLTRSKRPTLKIRYSRNSKVFVWNTNFFPWQAVAKISLFVHSTYTGYSPCQVCFDLDNYLNRWKRPISKIRYSRNPKISVWILTFFLHKPYQKLLVFL